MRKLSKHGAVARLRTLPPGHYDHADLRCLDARAAWILLLPLPPTHSFTEHLIFTQPLPGCRATAAFVEETTPSHADYKMCEIDYLCCSGLNLRCQ